MFGLAGERVFIYQGAEARLFRVRTAAGAEAVLKERFKKQYRHPALEARLTKARHQAEVRSSGKAREAGVLTPQVLQHDPSSGQILMELVDGRPLRELLDSEAADTLRCAAAARALGAEVAKLHNAGIAHGDLTTSNVLERRSDGRLVVIDFGLSKPGGASPEDKAVDIYVLERAFSSTHPGSEALFKAVLESYAKGLEPPERDRVLAKLKQVQMRGRKRDMLG